MRCYLAARGYWAIRINSGAGLGIHNGKRRFFRFTSEPGCADVLAIKSGRPPLWIETKRAGKKQSPAQLAFEERAKRNGCDYFVAHSLSELVDFLGEAAA